MVYEENRLVELIRNKMENQETTSELGQDNKSPSSYVPDPRKHLYVSLGKSVVRIAGYALLFGIGSRWGDAAAAVLIISEAIGIVEELV